MKKFLLMFAIATVGLATNSQAQLSQDFESTTGTSLPTGWSQGTNTQPGWQTGTYGSFPAGQWSTSYFNLVSHTRYAQVTDQSATNLNTGDTLKSPSFSLSGVTNPFLKFDQLYGGYQYQSGPNAGKHETALVMISNNNGPWVYLDSVRGNASWTTQYTSLAAYANSTNVRIAFTYADQGAYLFGLAIDNVVTYSPPNNDIWLQSAVPVNNDPASAYGPTGGTLPISGTVENFGAQTITSFNVNYQIGNGTPVSFPVTGVSIRSFGTYNFTTGNITLPTTVGTYQVKIWTSLTGDVNHTNDSVTGITVGAYNSASLPTKRLLMEEGTGTWCGYCVRGIVFMDSLEELHGNGVSLVAVHNSASDPMTVTAYDNFETSFPGFTGFPNVIVDRRGVVDPMYLLDVYNSESGVYGFANISFGARTITGTSLSVPITVTPFFPLSGDYRVVMAVTEDNIHGPLPVTTTGIWSQHNYYSYQDNNQPLSGQGINYQDSLDRMTNNYFQHVARAITPSPLGTTNLPATMAVGTGYNATMTTTLPATWNRPFVKLVAMLVRGSDGVVLNSNNTTLWTEGVQSVTANVTHASVFPNPATTGSNVAFELSAKSTAQVRVTDMAGREVFATTAKTYAAGTYTIAIPTANFAAGVYNVTIVTNNGSLTDRLSVIK